MVGTGNDLGIGFSYNPASQVVARSQNNGAYDYPIAAVNQAYTSNGRNQYTQVAGTGGATLGWDLNGNLTSDGFTTFAYDTENRLTGASGAKIATLTYNPMGRLQQVANTSGTTRSLYDGDRLIAEYDASGVLQRRYVHGAGVDEPMVWYEGSAVSSATRRYLHADHQGSIYKQALKFDQEMALTGVETRPGLKRHFLKRIVSLSHLRMVNLGRRLLVNPQRRLTACRGFSARPRSGTPF